MYQVECLMSFCSPAVPADAYILTENPHALLYPHPPWQSGFSYQITLYHMTASLSPFLSPIVLSRCSWCCIPKPLWSLSDWGWCHASQLHSFTDATYCDCGCFCVAWYQRTDVCLISLLMNMILCRHWTDWYKYSRNRCKSQHFNCFFSQLRWYNYLILYPVS